MCPVLAAPEIRYTALRARPFTKRSRDEARPAIFEHIEGFYNTRRRHSSLDYDSAPGHRLHEASRSRDKMEHVVEAHPGRGDRLARSLLRR